MISSFLRAVYRDVVDMPTSVGIQELRFIHSTTPLWEQVPPKRCDPAGGYMAGPTWVWIQRHQFMGSGMTAVNLSTQEKEEPLAYRTALDGNALSPVPAILPPSGHETHQGIWNTLTEIQKFDAR